MNLSFLLETDYADILRELAIEQDRFRSALRTLNERSRLHREQLQVRMERAGISDGDTISSQDLLTKLGKNHVLMMISLTDSVIQAFDTTLESHIDVAKRFTDAMNECFPKKLKSGRKQVLGIGTGQRLRLASSDPSFPDQ